MSTSNEISNLVNTALSTDSASEASLAGEQIFRLIDKHGTSAVDVHVFRRELMKMNSAVENNHWKRFLAFLGTGTDSKVRPHHFQKAIRKHLRVFSVLKERKTVFSLQSIVRSEELQSRSKMNCVWVRGDGSLNRLSGTTLFEMSVVDGPSLQRIYQVFCEIDEDSDGWITLHDLKTYMRRHDATMLPIATSLFNAADSQRQGHISFEQIMRALYPACLKSELDRMVSIARPHQQPLRTKLESTIMEDVVDIFRVYDDNGDNTLDLEEFCSAVESLGWTQSEAVEIFAEIDQDSSGLVSLEEFVNWYTNHGENSEVEVRDFEILED